MSKRDDDHEHYLARSELFLSVHGEHGIHQNQANYAAWLNAGGREWMRGERSEMPADVLGVPSCDCLTRVDAKAVS